ncbi:RING finger protein 228-like [Pholidichthys leucotaenia]
MAEELSHTGRNCASSSSSDEFECKICYNYFDLERRTPKLLSCRHTFCQECLETLHFREGRGWRIGCPVCRHRTPVPEYLVNNLQDNAALTGALPPRRPVVVDSSSCSLTEERAAPWGARSSPDGGSSGSSTGGGRWTETCERVAFRAGCVCAIFTFTSMVVFLFLGLVFVHNFSHVSWLVGPVCLFVAGILALLSSVLIWVTFMLYRPETETGNFSSLTPDIT